MANFFAQDEASSLNPIQKYTFAIKLIKENKLKELEALLSSTSFTATQLSELLIHAGGVNDYKIAAALISKGAEVSFDSHRIWHIALNTDNRNLIHYLREVSVKSGNCGHNLYVVV